MTPDALAAAGLLLEVTGPVVSITLDRPEVRNAQTPAMWRALAAVGAELPEETDLLTMSDEQMSATIDGYQRGFTFLRDPRFVSIAAVQGHAVGAGFQLALSCDLRVVADDAQFSMKESALGLVPDLTGTKPLVESVGYARALEICATARTVRADEAVAIGLALAVVPAAELDATVADLAGALTAPLAGAVVETKALLLGAAQRDLEDQRRLEREAQVRRFREVARLMISPGPRKE
jgi:enoyl-CoA hydratase/carnithine racemase